MALPTTWAWAALTSPAGPKIRSEKPSAAILSENVTDTAIGARATTGVDGLVSTCRTVAAASARVAPSVAACAARETACAADRVAASAAASVVARAVALKSANSSPMVPARASMFTACHRAGAWPASNRRQEPAISRSP
jgi:hypothetical protein